jgi:hypothetical protein
LPSFFFFANILLGSGEYAAIVVAGYEDVAPTEHFEWLNGIAVDEKTRSCYVSDIRLAKGSRICKITFGED